MQHPPMPSCNGYLAEHLFRQLISGQFSARNAMIGSGDVFGRLMASIVA